MKVYVATGLPRIEEARAAMAALRDAGHEISYDWTVHGSVAAHGPKVWAETSQKEAEGVATADALIVLMPGGRGTHTEMGIAIGRNIPIVVVGDQEAARENPCVFHWHANVLWWVRTVAAAVDYLRLLADTTDYLQPFPSSSIASWQRAVHSNSRAHGWWDGVSLDDPNVIASKLALIHSEASEALEAMRERPDPADLRRTIVLETGKPTGFASELADIVIRCMNLAGALGIELGTEIERKHRYNKSRPFKHGGKAI